MNSEETRKYLDSRYEVMAGPNTHQLWVYDNETDLYIDPPAGVLHEVMSELDDLWNYEKACDMLKAIILDENPSWLNDEGASYDDIEI